MFVYNTTESPLYKQNKTININFTNVNNCICKDKFYTDFLSLILLCGTGPTPGVTVC